MATSEVPAPPASRRRRVVFALVGGLVALALLPSTANVLAPWMVVNVEELTDPGHMRWGLALEGAVDLLILVCLAVAVARPARSALLVQYVLSAGVLAAAVVTPFTGFSFLITVGMLLLIPLTYPYPRELFTLRSQQGPSAALLLVAVAASAVLLPLAVKALRIQATLPRGAGSDFNALATNAEHLVLLALAGLLASTRRPGWRLLAIAVSTTYAYLAIASVLLPHQPSSWGLPGAVASLLAAAAFAAATAVAATHTQAVPVDQPSLSLTMDSAQARANTGNTSRFGPAAIPGRSADE